MDVSHIASASTALANNANQQAVSIAMLKKAMNLQAQGAAQLLQTLPSPPSATLPHLGNHVNTVA